MAEIRIRKRMVRAGCGAFLLAVVASGCGLFGGNKGGATEPARALRIKTVTLAAVPGANQNWPVPVELVRVGDTALVDELLDIASPAWFGAEGDAFRDGHPAALFDAWEVVPGTEVGPFEVRARGRLAGVLFCGTRAAPPPLRVDKDGDVTVDIDDDGCKVSGGRERGPLSLRR